MATYFLFFFLFSFISHSTSKIVSTRCDLSRGNWVLDNSYPLYKSADCPFIERIFDCQRNGRPDSDYAKLRWQPDGCNLPRFDASGFISKVRGKRVIFVGDSLSLNQWQSLTCMLHSALPHANYTLDTINGLSTFTLPSQGVTLMFFRNAFLVDIVTEARGRVLRLDSMSTTGVWGRADVMIFDSWHWWFHTGRKQPWDWVVDGKTTTKDIDRMVAYEKALNTWARWIDANVDAGRVQVIFQGISPDHDGGDLGLCQGKTEPLKRPGSPSPGEVILERILKRMGKSVKLLDISSLSQMRIDGHPSVYGNGGHRNMDCTHWCLSGVPDTWNQYLYALLD
ncbi:hypothetical protein M569_06809 [Genlisea aurea]|uniref:Uncharacterized protein n=1 Tax=Genlisea aurea TaxID=192259 RepID=S8DXF9_9LAMI|nr:hypothetical protein M569_06809 [Genlisea aurea]